MGEKRSSLHESVPNTKKKFRVLKHQYFLGFVWKRRFFFIERVPDTVQKKKIQEYIFTLLLCALERRRRRRRRPLIRKSGGVVFI